jgi:hypothetical protein
MRFGFLLFLALTPLGGGGCSRVLSSKSADAVQGSGSEVIAMNEQVDPPMKRNATDRPPANQAAKDLRAYYEDEKKEPAWQDAIRRLSAADANQRTQAASYLNDFLDQALKDELAGADPRQPFLFWGEGPTSKARMFPCRSYCTSPGRRIWKRARARVRSSSDKLLNEAGRWLELVGVKGFFCSSQQGG